MAHDRAKEPFSARLEPGVLARLREQASRTGTAQTALVERYIDEGLRRDEHPLIYFRDDGAARRPALVGTRLDVWQVIETIRQNDNSPAAAAEYLELPLAHVDACVAYYADYATEIDAWTIRAREEAERAESAWRRREQLFA